MLYHYKARTPQGKVMEGTVDAPNQREAAATLRGRGLLVTSLTENRALSVPAPTARRGPASAPATLTRGAAAASAPSGRLKISQKDLSLFCRQFSTMIDAGVSILVGLSILSRQMSSKRMRLAVNQVCRSIEQGQSLSDAFRARPDCFPPILVNMVAAGEAGGILEECFQRLAEHFEKEHAVSQKVKSAMTYPAIVSLVSVGVVVFMVVFVLPSFIGIFSSIGAEMPRPTMIILGISNFIRAFWYLLAAAVALLLIFYRFIAATPGGAYALDALALRTPIFGDVVLKRAVSRFARTLGTLLRSGVPLLVCLSVTEKTVGSRPVAAAIAAAGEEIRSGRGISEPLRESGLFPQMVVEMMVVGEETGAIDQMLSKVADFYDKEIDATVERLTSMVEPVIIVFMGGVVGFILLALIMPMFDVYTQLSL